MIAGVPAVPAYVERRERCPRYVFAGGIWIVLADRRQTDGNITNVESVYQRGGGLPRLVNLRESEMAYVISGRLRVRIADEAETIAEPGALIFVPPGTPRRFRAEADDTRVYHGFVPAGFERLIVSAGTSTEEMIAPLDAAPLDADQARSHGVVIVPE